MQLLLYFNSHSLSKSMKQSDDIMKIIEDVIEIPEDHQKKDGNSIWSSLPNLELTPVSDLTADTYISQNYQGNIFNFILYLYSEQLIFMISMLKCAYRATVYCFQPWILTTYFESIHI